MCGVGLFPWFKWPTWQSLLLLAVWPQTQHWGMKTAPSLSDVTNCDKVEQFPLFVFLAFFFSSIFQFVLFIYEMS